MELLTAVLIFILGTIIGSFLSVVIYRLEKKKKSIFISRSMCPSCKKKIKPHHLVPVFSWLFLRGKCAYCGKKISVHYFALELMTGLLFTALFLKFNFIVATASSVDPTFFLYGIDWQIFQLLLFNLIVFSLLMAIFFYDLKHQIIPDRLSLPAFAIALAGNIVFGTIPIMEILIGAAAISGFFLVQFLISKGKWIGGGDIRLGLIIGALLGWRLGLTSLVLAYLIGALFSIALMASGKLTRKSHIAFGPFLITGIAITTFFGPQILNWYINTFTF